MTDVGSISVGFAFLAGLVSFLSPCVLPLVPSYVTYVTGMTVTELTTIGHRAARGRAALHAGLFVLGFGLVFIALGATATAFGATLRRALPLLQQIGGIVIAGFGLYLLGLLRLPFLMRERRVHLASKPAGLVGSVVAGVAFGAGWTPCVGPVLASILVYAGMQATMAKGLLLLAAYTLGLGLPFFAAAVGFNWYLVRAPQLSRWLRPIERVSGALLLVVGILLFTGRFTLLSNFFAGFGQLIDVRS
ncbi:MAG: cytochrome c biogenesis CcdA family protein [Gemmatimonadaceae bacterium]